MTGRSDESPQQTWRAASDTSNRKGSDGGGDAEAWSGCDVNASTEVNLSMEREGVQQMQVTESSSGAGAQSSNSPIRGQSMGRSQAGTKSHASVRAADNRCQTDSKSQLIFRGQTLNLKVPKDTMAGGNTDQGKNWYNLLSLISFV